MHINNSHWQIVFTTPILVDTAKSCDIIIRRHPLASISVKDEGHLMYIQLMKITKIIVKFNTEYY